MSWRSSWCGTRSPASGRWRRCKPAERSDRAAAESFHPGRALITFADAPWRAQPRLLSTALFASPAHAAAVVLRDSGSHTHVFTAGEFFCLPPDQVGTVTFTENSTGQFVETDGGVFTFHGVDAFDIRVDFPDGSYIQSELDRDLKSFVLNPPLTVFTVITQDMETIYNAQGKPIGTIAVHIVSHLTYTDLNGNGQPDDGDVKAQVEQFRLRCA